MPDKDNKVEKVVDGIEDRAEKGAVHFQKEVTSFLVQTSIKGVPRAVKNTNKKLKVLWVVGVLSLLCKCFLLLEFLKSSSTCARVSFDQE